MPGSKNILCNNQVFERSTIINNLTQKFDNFKNNNIPDELVLTMVNDFYKLQTKTTNAIPDNQHIRKVSMLLRLNKKLMERKNNII